MGMRLVHCGALWVEQDAWRGTQLLSHDVALALSLLQEASLGAKLTDRQGKVLQRTLTDLASVIPIGIIMAIPVRRPPACEPTQLLSTCDVAGPRQGRASKR